MQKHEKLFLKSHPNYTWLCSFKFGNERKKCELKIFKKYLNIIFLEYLLNTDNRF